MRLFERILILRLDFWTEMQEQMPASSRLARMASEALIDRHSAYSPADRATASQSGLATRCHDYMPIVERGPALPSSFRRQKGSSKRHSASLRSPRPNPASLRQAFLNQSLSHASTTL